MINKVVLVLSLLQVKEAQGDYMEAINLYMKAGLPARAARLALSIDVSIIKRLLS